MLTSFATLLLKNIPQPPKIKFSLLKIKLTQHDITKMFNQFWAFMLTNYDRYIDEQGKTLRGSIILFKGEACIIGVASRMVSYTG